ncbi:hypothetical protein FACS1894184_04970 [Clostridia bacterium]|nr:hypothetical protein FACS1894184_04970 [Clostridia bacterium]
MFTSDTAIKNIQKEETSASPLSTDCRTFGDRVDVEFKSNEGKRLNDLLIISKWYRTLPFLARISIIVVPIPFIFIYIQYLLFNDGKLAKFLALNYELVYCSVIIMLIVLLDFLLLYKPVHNYLIQTKNKSSVGGAQ